MVLNDSNFQLSRFDDLEKHDLYQILRLRSEVFVLEQNCAYQDIDGLDQKGLHLYKKTDNGVIVACARILSPELNRCETHTSQHCSIGRVVVKKSLRHEKIGHALMKKAINVATKHFPEYPIIISAQTYLSGFYQQLGFVNTGHFYLEDQIPHQQMFYQPK